MLMLALRNLLRQKLRSTITLAAIVAGVAGLILSGGFVNDILFQLGEILIQTQSGHLQVAKRGYFEEGSRKPEAYLMEDPAKLAARLAGIPGVKTTMARMEFSALLNNGKADMAIGGDGVEPEKEAMLGSALTMVAGRRLTAKDRGGILLGEPLAKAMKLKPGDAATLMLNTPEGAANALDFTVIGVFRGFSKDHDARAVRVLLSDAQELMGRRGANVVVVALERTELTARALLEAEGLTGAGMEVKPWHSLNDFYQKSVDLYDQQFGVLRLIIFLMVLLGVANSVNMTAFERIGEFGTIRALGYRGGYARRLFIVEQTAMGVVGSTVGLLAGLALAWVISLIGVAMPPAPGSDLPYVARIRLDAATLGLAWGVGVLAAVLASLWPARRLARVPVVDALRQNV
jgi:putative ABC transport system permease protein